MELLLISNDKLKVTLSVDDMEKYDISCDSIDYDSTETRRAFWSILDEAKHRTGFDAARDKVCIQVYPSRSGGCEMFVTRLCEKEKEKEKEKNNSAVECRALRVYAKNEEEIAKGKSADDSTFVYRFSDIKYARKAVSLLDCRQGVRYSLFRCKENGKKPSGSVLLVVHSSNENESEIENENENENESGQSADWLLHLLEYGEFIAGDMQIGKKYDAKPRCGIGFHQRLGSGELAELYVREHCERIIDKREAPSKRTNT